MKTKVSRRIRQGVGSVAAGLSLFMFAGCSDFLEVENPGSLLDEDLERPELLETHRRVAARGPPSAGTLAARFTSAADRVGGRLG